MKKLSILLLGIFIMVLVACSGSDTYRGSWKAMNAEGAKYDMVFDAKSFSIKDSAGKTENYDYTQNSVNVSNSVETYGITLKDGRKFQIHFPKADDESIGLIKDENGGPMYTIGRNAYIEYEDIYKLN